jgi:hypothetical protein
VSAALAGIGHNMPPLSPFEIAQKAIEDVCSEASMWLDGATVDNKELADGIDNLKKTIAAARKAADEARKVENKPFDDGKADVQGRYNPLLKKADLAKDACNKALEPWLNAEAKRIEDEARVAREAAEELQRKAQEAIRATNAANLANLAERAAAEALVTAAKKANIAANKAERVTATAGGAFGRATALRKSYVAVIADEQAFARYVWANHRDDLTEFLSGLAKRLVDGGARDIPGVLVDEERKAV